jgi:hypothetical protein
MLKSILSSIAFLFVSCTDSDNFQIESTSHAQLAQLDVNIKIENPKSFGRV